MATKKSNSNLNKSQNKKSAIPEKKPIDPKSIFQWKKAGKTSLVWLLIIVGAIIVSGIFSNSSKKEIEVEYFQYQEYLKTDQISKGTIIENIFHGEFKIPQNIDTKYGTIESGERFFV